MTTDMQMPAAPSSQFPKLRIALLIVAGIEILNSVSNLPIIFGNRVEILGAGLAGWLLAADLTLLPLIAIAAFILALKYRLGHAVIALAAMIVLTWLTYVPSIILNWTEFPGSGLGGAIVLLQAAAFPLLALAAAALAWRNERLVLATVFVSLPTIVGLVGVLAFAISVALYGF